VRVKVNQLLVARQDSNADVVEALNTRFNTMYGMKLPYRNNHPDGSPKNGEIVQYAVALILLLSIVFVGYAAILFGIMIVTALVLGAASAGRLLPQRMSETKVRRLSLGRTQPGEVLDVSPAGL
jgi:hypothetical protein